MVDRRIECQMMQFLPAPRCSSNKVRYLLQCKRWQELALFQASTEFERHSQCLVEQLSELKQTPCGWTHNCSLAAILCRSLTAYVFAKGGSACLAMLRPVCSTPG